MVKMRLLFAGFRILLSLFLVPLAAALVFAQGSPAYVDPQIKGALNEISAGQVQSDIEKLVSFQTRSTLSAQDAASIAAARGIGAAREWIKSEFERYSRECAGCLEVKTDSYTQAVGERVPSPTVITNVYAVLRGTNPEDAKRIVVVTGHYDSRNSNNDDRTGVAPGANDDASGTVVSLECARVLSKLKFPGTIIFLAVAGEEQGLYGSKHFAEMAKKSGWQIEAVLNNDIVGGDQSPGQNPSLVRVFSESIPDKASERDIRMIRALGGENDSASRELARYAVQTAHIYQPGVDPTMEFRLDRYLRGGDHISFNEEGFPAVRFTEFRENFNRQHQDVRTENGIEYGDLPKFVNFDYVANVARVNAATLASLAAAPGPPQNVKLETKELVNDSTLHWDAPIDGRAAGYDVVWRATTAPDWESSQHVLGNLTRATVPVSKDNVIFAVQAVDEAGHRSLPVVPAPER
ncbi:MAG TPA: M28 family metallopeptidase [Terriglobales bacterium]|nr:M28 family metallopeptidase [Terriglobales bacterium]